VVITSSSGRCGRGTGPVSRGSAPADGDRLRPPQCRPHRAEAAGSRTRRPRCSHAPGTVQERRSPPDRHAAVTPVGADWESPCAPAEKPSVPHPRRR
jgi:hypothetical protein